MGDRQAPGCREALLGTGRHIPGCGKFTEHCPGWRRFSENPRAVPPPPCRTPAHGVGGSPLELLTA